MFQRLLPLPPVLRKSRSRLGAAGKWRPSSKFPLIGKEKLLPKDEKQSSRRFIRTIVFGYNVVFFPSLWVVPGGEQSVKKNIYFALNPQVFCVLLLIKLQDLGYPEQQSLRFCARILSPHLPLNIYEDSTTKGSWETEFV